MTRIRYKLKIYEKWQIEYLTPYLPLLTAALCRSADIPARAAIGYILSDNSPGEIILSPHMWVEVWLDNTWYPIDSTGHPGKMNPFKIRFLSGSLNNDEISKFFDSYVGMSQIEVELISIVNIKNRNVKKTKK